MKTLKFLSIVALSGLMLACNDTSSNTEAEIQEKSPQEVQAMLGDDNIVMIDVRSADELKTKAYDVDGIINIPLDEFDQRLNEIPKDKTIIVACRSGKRSSKAANILLENGYQNIINLDGGILKWEKEGLDIIAQSACCSDPSSANCNPDGTCKEEDKKASCPGSSSENCNHDGTCKVEDKKACCSDPSSSNCNPDGTCKTDENE